MMDTADQWNDFSKKSDYHDKALVVEESEFWICSGTLASLSPVFYAMFFGEFTEKAKEKVELPGKRAEDILEMLRCVIPIGTGPKPIDETNVVTLAKLADEYQIYYLKKLCIIYLDQLSDLALDVRNLLFEAAENGCKEVLRRTLPLYAHWDSDSLKNTLDQMPEGIRVALMCQRAGQQMAKKINRTVYKKSTCEECNQECDNRRKTVSISSYICENCNLPTVYTEAKRKHYHCLHPLAALELEKIGM